MNKLKWLFLAMMLGQSLSYAAPLHDAIKAQDLEKVRSLLKRGANVNSLKNGFSPLMYAVQGNAPNLAIIENLLKAGPNINAKTEYGYTAISFARGKPEILSAIHVWSIENQVPVTDPADREKLVRAYGTKEQRAAKVEAVTSIPTDEKNPGKYILEYMGED